jgi:leucine dehydrogenase
VSYFGDIERLGFEEIVFCHDRVTGLNAIIAIHDTTLGPGMGGVRMKPYASEQEAFSDVLALSRAMTYKAAAAGLDLGGAKGVIIGDPGKDKNEALLRAFGRFVERLGGRYITAVDAGINEFDIDCIRRETSYALGGTPAGCRGGCPSPATAHGVLQGMKACAMHVYGSPSLEGLTVAVQGLGGVGSVLCGQLVAEGAKLVVADIDEAKVKTLAAEWQASRVDPAVIHKVKCDIFAPCALGGVINRTNIDELNCRIIAGAANNTLSEEALGEVLHEKGILYAPDYVINAGGLTYIAYERTSYLPEEIMSIVGRIGDRLAAVLKRAAQEKVPPYQVADRMAEERIKAGKGLLTLRSKF